MKTQNTSLENKRHKGKWSSKKWIIVGVCACIVGFVAARVWITWGFCIPCYIEAGWNGICTWVSTGVNPFW
jgi:hypothetical protein